MSKWSDVELHGYVSAAERGGVADQMWLGWAYWEGKFIAPDLALASRWLESATAGGDPEASYRFASFLHAMGQVERVLDLLRDAADKGFPPAAYALGGHYRAGRITPRDMDQAIAAWRRAVALGHIPAEAQLVRARIQAVSLIHRPLVWLRLVPISLRAVQCFWRDPNDPRVLGA
ncbi:tetratricopeptide repeat protein [Methylobacterium thuringiense]|uniref:tetratricopeptide repeat protein n=1 Tax=Methylobacterium thuringiense TaxID=1003091 RepID=UPI001EDE46A6|nr:tetratricopeptide repeat protein [Methylobacterium thuringiense]